jgi:hypothetical protein
MRWAAPATGEGSPKVELEHENERKTTPNEMTVGRTLCEVLALHRTFSVYTNPNSTAWTKSPVTLLPVFYFYSF